MTTTTIGPETTDALHEMASQATGLDDFGDNAHLPAMEVLLESYAREAQFTPAGVEFHMGAVVGALTARLFSEAAWRANPGYQDVRIERPILITGVARTGTTALNRLLCAPANHQGLDLWLANVPQPRPPRDTWDQHPEYQMVRDSVEALPYSREEFAHIHYVKADLPEECDMLSQQYLMGNMWAATANVPTYQSWLEEQDWTPALERNRANLQLIAMTEPEKRWVLKNPGHLYNLDEFLAIYPDALVVWTHRDPRTSIPSICSVLEKLAPGTSELQTGPHVGPRQLDYYANGVEKAMAARARHPEEQFLDVYYEDFVANPMAIVEQVYDRLGAHLPEQDRSVIESEENASKLGHRRPDHRYALADYGLTEGQVRERFTGYLEAHPQVLEPRE
jgi:hypothetical protein